jgi:hypothetical protein
MKNTDQQKHKTSSSDTSCHRLRSANVTNALSDPSHGIVQKLDGSLQALVPAHTQAVAFLNNLESTSAEISARLQHLNGIPAEEQVEHYAKNSVTHLIESSHKVALEICPSTLKSVDKDQQILFKESINHHYIPRPVKNKRCSLSKQLHQYRIKVIRNLVFSPFINAQGTTTEITNIRMPSLQKAIQAIKHK